VELKGPGGPAHGGGCRPARLSQPATVMDSAESQPPRRGPWGRARCHRARADPSPTLPAILVAAGVAELVDAADLKSSEPRGSCGFNPHLRHHFILQTGTFCGAHRSLCAGSGTRNASIVDILSTKRGLDEQILGRPDSTGEHYRDTPWLESGTGGWAEAVARKSAGGFTWGIDRCPVKRPWRRGAARTVSAAHAASRQQGLCHMPALTSAKTFACAICSAVLSSQRDLDNHMCLLHDDCGEAHLGTPITFRCVTCGQAFAHRGDLFAHLRQRGQGHPAEWDMARPAGTQRPRGRPRRRSA
jgi:hypothetical protein